MKIVRPNWKWAVPPAKRIGPPSGYFVHHAAGDLDAAAIHRVHLNKGYRGIGYMYVVELDGRVVAGRPADTIGGHTNGWNDGIGICFSGNYDVRKEMPAKQLRAGQELYAYLSKERPKLKWTLHKNAPGNVTACPGRYFPWAEIKAGVPKKATRIRLTERDITVPRMHKPHRAGWWNYGLVPYIERLREQGDGKRVKAGLADPLVIPVPVERPKWWRELMAWKKKVREEAAAQQAEDADQAIADEAESDAMEDPQDLAPEPAAVPRKRSPFWWLRRKS